MRVTTIDEGSSWVTVSDEHGTRTFPLDSAEGFAAVSRAWLRSGWDVKYVYSFSWPGRPVIQLPEDLVRMQELIFAVKPDVLIETGVAHGGSLVFYASLFRVLEKGRVIGIEVDLKPQNRDAIRAGQLASLITLIDGSSVESSTLAEVRAQIKAGETVTVVLDSNHTRDHVLGELRAYAPLVTPGSYIVVCDGIMQELVGAPRSSLDWGWNNPGSAVSDFLSESKDFALAEPSFPFNESLITERVTYCPNAYLRRLQ
jgi:cephalosporin hydroxylase